ncbi:MAG: redoxin family protein, partial [Mycobacterium sp.]
MAQITLRGNPITTVGELPDVGSSAPGFALTGTDLGAVGSGQFRGKPVLLNIFPSIDTPVCATSVRTFNERAAGSGASVLCVSKDLPFAQ